MDFLNPLSIIFNLSLMSMNLYQMNDTMARDLSSTYTMKNYNEKFQMNKCPNSFQIEITTSNKPGHFFLRRSSHYQNVEGQPRLLLVDGKAHMLHDGEIMKASVLNDNSLQIEIFNETLPHEKIVETMTFNNNGTLVYKAQLENDHHTNKQTLCNEVIYKRS